MEDASSFFAPDLADIVDSYLFAQNDTDIDQLFATIPCDYSAPSTSSTTEFGSTSEEELKRLEGKNKNKNTSRSTNTWATRFQKWMSARGQQLSFEVSQASALDKQLAMFYAEL